MQAAMQDLSDVDGVAEEEEEEEEAAKIDAAEEQQQQALLDSPPQATLQGTITPISFDCVHSTSKKAAKEKPGKRGDARPAVYVSIQRATNKHNGQTKRWFLLDTGAERTSITEADAKVLNLFAKSQETGELTTKNAAGSTKRETVRVLVSALEAGKPVCSVELTASVRAGNLGHGLLGMDFVAAVGWANVDFAGSAAREAKKRGEGKKKAAASSAPCKGQKAGSS